MNIFLKWYYWYKNLWDEILFFWVVNYLYNLYSFDIIYVEVNDVCWFENWIQTNKELVAFESDKIKCVDKGYGWDEIKCCLKVFWWWEVLADQRPFPYDGWNMLIKYPFDILKGNFSLLGWIWTPRKFLSKLLYKILLPRADKIVVRENKSFEVANMFTKNVILHNDFAQDIVWMIKKLNLQIEEKNTALININSYIYNPDSVIKIKKFIKENSERELYFIPFDMFDDLEFYEHIKDFCPSLKLYDWTDKKIIDILEFMWWSIWWIWARLHFLLLLHWLGKKTYPLAYQEKINKFFG